MDTAPKDTEPVNLYYLAPELRRCVIWVICGFLLISSVPSTVYALMSQRNFVRTILIFTGFGGVGVAWFSQFLLPRIRVDQTGISRRVLWWWDLWSWDAFSAGHISHGFMRHSYVSSDRPWYRRELRLGLLHENDATQLDVLIRRIWTRPAAPPIPDTVKFRFNWFDGRDVELTAERLTVQRKDQRTDYRWDQVLAVDIWREDSDRRDFSELRIELPGQQFTLRMRAECRNWIGDSAEVIAACICENFQQQSLHDFSLHGTPRSLDELDALQSRFEAKAKKDLREMTVIIPVSLVAIVPIFFLAPWPKNLLLVFLFGLLGWGIQLAIREARRKIEKRRGQFEVDRAMFAQKSGEANSSDGVARSTFCDPKGPAAPIARATGPDGYTDKSQ